MKLCKNMTIILLREEVKNWGTNLICHHLSTSSVIYVILTHRIFSFFLSGDPKSPPLMATGLKPKSLGSTSHPDTAPLELETEDLKRPVHPFLTTHLPPH